MKQLTTILLLIAFALPVAADVRVNIRLGSGHPLERRARMVVVRPARPVVIREKVVYARPVLWTPRIVTAPARPRMVWEDSETFRRNEDWVDTMLKVNQRGDKLFLRVEGRVQVDFAEVHFGNGQVQVVEFKEGPLRDGTYSLLDFADGREVEYTRLVARARGKEARVSILLAR